MRKLMFVVFLTAIAALPQQDMSKVEIKVQKVAGTAADDEYAALARRSSRRNGITDKPIKFIINTHDHGDSHRRQRGVRAQRNDHRAGKRAEAVAVAIEVRER